MAQAPTNPIVNASSPRPIDPTPTSTRSSSPVAPELPQPGWCPEGCDCGSLHVYLHVPTPPEEVEELEKVLGSLVLTNPTSEEIFAAFFDWLGPFKPVQIVTGFPYPHIMWDVRQEDSESGDDFSEDEDEDEDEDESGLVDAILDEYLDVSLDKSINDDSQETVSEDSYLIRHDVSVAGLSDPECEASTSSDDDDLDYDSDDTAHDAFNKCDQHSLNSDPGFENLSGYESETRCPTIDDAVLDVPVRYAPRVSLPLPVQPEAPRTKSLFSRFNLAEVWTAAQPWLLHAAIAVTTGW